MATVDRVRALVEPIVDSHGVTLYDVTFAGGKLVVAITRSGGIDLEALTAVSRDLNATLDEHDPMGGSYTLEVTSPGLERPLRTPEHFAGAIGESVTVRTQPGVDGERRVRGTLKSADESSFTVVVDEKVGELAVGDERTLAYDQIERARTTFTWGDQTTKPGQNKGNKSGQKKPGQKKPGQKNKKSSQSKQKPSSGQSSGTTKKPQKKAPST